MRSKSIGFIGIGNVGSNLANNLLKSNYNIFIYDKYIKSYSKLKKLKNTPCKNLEQLAKKKQHHYNMLAFSKRCYKCY